MLTGHQTLGSRTGIHQRAIVRRVDVVAKEVILLLPVAVAVELAAGNLVQVHVGHVEFFRQLGQPLRLRLAHDVPVSIEGIARRERHQDGMCPLGAYLADVAAHVVAVAVDGVLPLRALIEADDHRVGVNAGNDGTRPLLVEKLAAVVVANGDQHPVACLERVAHGRPQVGVERARGHSAQRLIFNRYFPSVEELRGIESPAPLTVGAVAARAVAHGGIADEEQHGVRALTRGARCRARHQCLRNGVGCVVDGSGQRVAHARGLSGRRRRVWQVVESRLGHHRNRQQSRCQKRFSKY